jgi:hypothetical protein
MRQVLITNTLGLTLVLAGYSSTGTADEQQLEATMMEHGNETPYVQNDNVMGGRSQGGFEQTPGELIFAGSTNTNGGGFSSIRTQPFELDLSSHDGIRLRVKGDGRRYTWQLQTNARYRGGQVSYWAEFDTRADEWSTVDIPFASFYPQFRGFKLDGPELDPGQITELGLYIYDNQDGPFELRLASVQAYSADAT